MCYFLSHFFLLDSDGKIPDSKEKEQRHKDAAKRLFSGGPLSPSEPCVRMHGGQGEENFSTGKCATMECYT